MKEWTTPALVALTTAEDSLGATTPHPVEFTLIYKGVTKRYGPMS